MVFNVRNMRNRYKNTSGLSDESRKKVAEFRNRAKKIRRFYFVAITFADIIAELMNVALGLPEYISLSVQIFITVFILYFYPKRLNKHSNSMIIIGGFRPSWYTRHTNFKSEKITSRKKKNISNDGVNASEFPYDTSFEEHLYKN